MRAESRPGTFREQARRALPAALLATAIGASTVNASEDRDFIKDRDVAPVKICAEDIVDIVIGDKHNLILSSQSRIISTSSLDGDRRLDVAHISGDTGNLVKTATTMIFSTKYTDGDLVVKQITSENGSAYKTKGIRVRNLPADQKYEIFREDIQGCELMSLPVTIFSAQGTKYKNIDAGGTALETLLNIDKGINEFK